MPWWIWTHAIAIIVGIVIGALVWRNNAKKFEEYVKKGKEIIESAK